MTTNRTETEVETNIKDIVNSYISELNPLIFSIVGENVTYEEIEIRFKNNSAYISIILKDEYGNISYDAGLIPNVFKQEFTKIMFLLQPFVHGILKTHYRIDY